MSRVAMFRLTWGLTIMVLSFLITVIALSHAPKPRPVMQEYNIKFRTDFPWSV